MEEFIILQDFAQQSLVVPGMYTSFGVPLHPMSLQNDSELVTLYPFLSPVSWELRRGEDLIPLWLSAFLSIHP